jgi:hypothetical protein
MLVATSDAARGLDFPSFGYVVNFEDYTFSPLGRAGHLSKSISFF